MKIAILLLVTLVPALALAQQSQSNITTPGSAGCGSKTNSVYSVQFGWDAVNKLSYVNVTGRQDDEILSFNLNTDLREFSINATRDNMVVLAVKDSQGNAAKLNLTVDANRVGSGKISWKIKSENFEETNADAVCSF